METLLQASILLLDDQVQYLKTAKQFFSEKGIDIIIEQDLEKVLEESQLGKYDIILSDLDLHNISTTESGLTVLEKIRNYNSTVFLGLYTAYEYTLTNSQKKALKRNYIKIYRKDDQEAFWEDLISDYEQHQKIRENEKEELTEIVFFESIRKDVLNHLKNISNQNIFIPITMVDNNLTVKDLYEEVLGNSKIGRRFMMDWYENMKFISDIKNRHKYGK